MAHLFAKWIILLTLKMHEHETEQPKCAEFLQSFMPTADYSWSLQSFFSCLSLSFSSHSIMMIFLSNRCLLHVICFERYLVYIHTCIDVLVYGHDFLVLFFQNNFFFSRCYIIVSAVRYLLAVVAIYWSCLWIIRTFTITPVILP